MKMTDKIPAQFILGKDYTVKIGWGPTVLCRFIKPTNCGYNFLDLETNHCVLNQHLYPSKCENHSSGDWYWIHKNWVIKER